MKTKKFSKKLALNKETIIHLGNEEMHAVNGGEAFHPSLLSRCAYCPGPSITCNNCSITC